MRALVFGGSGQIGRAVAMELAEAGWQVEAVVRGGRSLAPEVLALGVTPLAALASRAALISRGYDAVVDTLAFTAADAADLLAEPAGHYTVISTGSVYADDQGRGFELRANGFPDYPDPIPETQTLVPAGEGYSAGKVAMELALGDRAAILRPAAIHGIGARHPREWWFVKRALDGRHRLPLVDAGRSVFHTSSTRGIASLTRHLAEQRTTGAFNVADPVALSVAEIAGAIGQQMGHAFEIVDHEVGHTPLSVPHPVRLSLAKARATGWDGGPSYQACLPDYVRWMILHASDWQTAFPVFQNYDHDLFDYAAEDAALD
ncbi:MAG: sugar nucleotide-binding protein [bacterium]